MTRFVPFQYLIRIRTHAIAIAPNGKTAALGRHAKFPTYMRFAPEGLLQLADVFIDVEKKLT